MANTCQLVAVREDNAKYVHRNTYANTGVTGSRVSLSLVRREQC